MREVWSHLARVLVTIQRLQAAEVHAPVVDSVVERTTLAAEQRLNAVAQIFECRGIALEAL